MYCTLECTLLNIEDYFILNSFEASFTEETQLQKNLELLNDLQVDQSVFANTLAATATHDVGTNIKFVTT